VRPAAVVRPEGEVVAQSDSVRRDDGRTFGGKIALKAASTNVSPDNARQPKKSRIHPTSISEWIPSACGIGVHSAINPNTNQHPVKKNAVAAVR